ncbi:MAG: arginine deiminase [Chloroflexia bacterium]|nr:arginine deiminase [Chloroflexia bacterium]
MFGLGRHPEKSEIEVAAEVAIEHGYGGQSMVAPLKRVLVQQPAPPAHDDDWRRYGYRHPVDHGQAVEEHAALCQVLAAEGIEVIIQPADEPGRLDSIFVYDASILTDEGAVLANPGKALRRGEVDRAREMYDELGVPVIGPLEDPAIIEGGDAFWINASTLAVGIGYRTNTAGIDLLQTYIRPFGIDVLPVALPHWRGPDECLHLLSLISPVADRTAVVYPSLISTPFMQILHGLEWTLIEVPEDEFTTQGTNVLALAPNKVLILKENVQTKSLLEAAGVEVLTYTGDEISHNRQGGPTCLTRPLLRDVSGG